MRRWVILGLGLGAQAASCVFLYGLPSLVPDLRADEHLSLSAAGAVVAAPSVGLLLTLIAWGAVADRYGERLVIAGGLALAAVLLVVAITAAHGPVALGVVLAAAGAGGASVNAASGRLVLGWFASHERGLAMGIRQTAQPLGVGIGALTLPVVAAHGGVRHALWVPAALCALFAVLVVLFARDPVRAPRGEIGSSGTPYRSPLLWRVHAASACLVVPQFAVSAFTLAYLVSERGIGAVAAGRIVFGMQVAGAAGRIVAGIWSDRVDSRMRPMRQLAVGSAALMLGIALCDLAHSWLAIVAFGLAAIVTVADNGLAFTAVAELAGSAWAGRALGVQNTGQNVVAAATPPVLGALIGAHGYAVGFAVAAVLPLLAIALTPVTGADAARRSARTAARSAAG